jgi:hypothetical protein
MNVPVAGNAVIVTAEIVVHRSAVIVPRETAVVLAVIGRQQ